MDLNQFMNSVKGGHSYDSSVEDQCNVNDLLGIVNNILSGAIPLVDKDISTKKDLTNTSQTIMSSDISHLIDWICCQITCEATRRETVEERLQAIFEKLRSYQWTTQVLLVLAAFALRYGDFWFAYEAPSEARDALSSNYLLKGLSSLKKKVISDENKKAAIKPLNRVVNDLWELTTSLLDLSKLVNQHRGKHVSELPKAFRELSGWSCETIIAILAAGNIFAQIIHVHEKFTESGLENLKSSVSDKKNAVLTTVNTCKEQIGRIEDYQKYVKKVEAPVDIVDFLRSLLAKDSSLDPIITGPDDKLVKFESFRKKNVLLIISELNISEYDIATFESLLTEDDLKDGSIQIQTENETHYELVWIPIVDATPHKLEAPPNFKSMREWTFMVDPHKMNGWAAKYIKEEWHFNRETMVVVLDSFGWVENTDAMPMLRIWGRDASPYIEYGSTHLWKDPWVHLILQELVDAVPVDVKESEHILFYGGTAATKLAADATGGPSNLRSVRIENTKFFFIQLRSLLICKLRALQISNPESNPLLDPIVYEMCEAYKACPRGGFAILTQGPDLRVQHVGLLSEWERVRDQVAKPGWTALAERFKKEQKDGQGKPICLDAAVPHYAGLGDLFCPVCSRFIRYDHSLVCCHSDAD